MSPVITEQYENFIDEIRVRTGFRVVGDEFLAGGPVELEFVVENNGRHPFQVTIAGDRIRQRPAQFSFTARFEGVLLHDPMADAPYLGGPSAIVRVQAHEPWRQLILLNQFVRLEDTSKYLRQGAKGRIEIVCERTLDFSPATAQFRHRERTIIIKLAFDLHRNDETLASLTNRLLKDVMEDQPALRERSLLLLLSMRTNARSQIVSLVCHHNKSVAARAQQAISNMP